MRRTLGLLGFSVFLLAAGCGSPIDPSGDGASDGSRDGGGIDGNRSDIGGTGDQGTGDNGVTDDGGGTGNSDGSGPVADSACPGGLNLVTCASAMANCGPIGDGCGGIIPSCGTCTGLDTCGGGGVPSRCGRGADGGTSACVQRTCSSVGANCGQISDTCGGLTPSCGMCTGIDTCGGGGMPNVCGHPTIADGGTLACPNPRTCASVGANCGQVSNGCGALTPSCGTCTGLDTCGGGGVANVCGHPAVQCVPRTCATAGANCGQVADGCGSLTPSCGTCPTGQICGGGGVSSSCGGTSGTTCTGLCLQQMTCTGGRTTTVSGTAFAPTPAVYGSPDPLYGALVYVPNGPVAPFPAGVSCDRCGATASGSPLVSATTGPDGKFTLTNVPVGTNIPLVIQLGRWRRQVVIPTVTACVDTPLPASLTRLPRNHLEGDIPLIAMVTGDVDSMECVLRKIGIDDGTLGAGSVNEFTNPGTQGGTGRVRFYQANGATVDNRTPAASQLWGANGDISQYDMVLFACEGGRNNKAAADQQRVIAYANQGGRVFATHFSYVWLTDGNMTSPTPFSQTAGWNLNQGNTASATATVDQTFNKGIAFARWLQLVGASTPAAPATPSGQVGVNVVRHDFDTVNVPAQRWLYTANQPLHYTFNTPTSYPPAAPIPAANQCGRVVFSDFHVTDATGNGRLTFPRECTGGPMTAQEKVLEFMLFDLASCISAGPTMSMCVPQTCATARANCGPIADGCGATIPSCGTCTAPDVCGGGGTFSVCGRAACTPKTCAQQNIQCGPAGDGCGGMIPSCGTCTAPTTCGGGGTPGVCGNGGCIPQTCAQQNIQCGPAGNGCGGLIASCGACTAPDTCGGAGVAGRCGRATCTPRTCAAVGANCGIIADGCGSTLDCGTCQSGQFCGGLGTPNVCGAPG